MKEKYIATFLNPDAWTDVRRYQYNSAIYQGMSKPVNYNEALGGEFIRRVLYPTDEVNRNGAEVTATHTTHANQNVVGELKPLSNMIMKTFNIFTVAVLMLATACYDDKDPVAEIITPTGKGFYSRIGKHLYRPGQRRHHHGQPRIQTGHRHRVRTPVLERRSG